MVLQTSLERLSCYTGRLGRHLARIVGRVTVCRTLVGQPTSGDGGVVVALDPCSLSLGDGRDAPVPIIWPVIDFMELATDLRQCVI
jgi:hypothetical protein